jgi:DNA-binding Lrp family transcriptional regulator
MVRAYILLQTDVGAAGAAAAGAAALKGVKDAAAVAGPYDVILTVEAADLDALGRLVVTEVQALGGVRRTLTCPVIHL